MRPPDAQDAAPIAAHIRTLRAAGMHARDIAAASRLPIGTINTISCGRVRYVYGDTARRLLAVTDPTPQPPHGHVEATQARRQMQALAAIGHPLRAVGNRTGMANKPIYDLTHNKTRHVTIAHADAIAAAYRDWSDKPGPSKRAATNARKQRWAPPIAWDDDTIADPAAKPYDSAPVIVDEVAIQRATRGDRTVKLTRAERSEAVRTLTARGHTKDWIAEQLGISDRAVDRWRATHRDEAAA